MSYTTATLAVYLFSLLSSLSNAADNPCTGLEPPSSARGCFCFFASASDFIGNVTALPVPGLSEAVDNITDVCAVAALYDAGENSTAVPITAYVDGEWNIESSSDIEKGLAKEACENGRLPGFASVTEGLQFKKDHGRDPLCDKSGDGGKSNDDGGSEKGCYSFDTELVFGIGEKVVKMGDLKVGDGGQVVHVQHAERIVKKDVLCVENDQQVALCATRDHVVRYYGQRHSMSEICEKVECYEKKGVRVVNPLLRFGVVRSPLAGFELTDEVDWVGVPRIMTSVGARLLAIAMDAKNVLANYGIVSSHLTKDLL